MCADGGCQVWVKATDMPEAFAEAVLEACGVIRAPDPVARVVHPAPELPGPLGPLPCKTGIGK